MKHKHEEFILELCKDNESDQIDAILEMCDDYISDDSFAGSGFGLIVMYDMWINECGFWPTNNPKLWKEWKKLKRKKINKEDMDLFRKNNNEVTGGIEFIFESEEMIFNGAWITPNGHILGVPLTHIMSVIEDPGLFVLSREEIKEVFNRHNEDFGAEGNARDEIITKLVFRGWIRIRYHPGVYEYEIELNKLDIKHKEQLSDWTSKVINKYPDRASFPAVVRERLACNLKTTLTKLSKNDI